MHVSKNGSKSLIVFCIFHHGCEYIVIFWCSIHFHLTTFVYRNFHQAKQVQSSFVSMTIQANTIDYSMSRSDLRTCLKRDLLCSTRPTDQADCKRSKNTTKGANCKIKHAKVSFGCMQETVLFDTQDSSCCLSLGVSVSDSSLASNTSSTSSVSLETSLGNFRWQDSTQAARNAPPLQSQKLSFNRWSSNGQSILANATYGSGSSIRIPYAPVRQGELASATSTDNASALYTPSTPVAVSNVSIPPRRPIRCTSPIPSRR